MIVVDASAVVDVLLDLEPHSKRIGERFEEEAGGLLTLHLLDASRPSPEP